MGSPPIQRGEFIRQLPHDAEFVLASSKFSSSETSHPMDAIFTIRDATSTLVRLPVRKVIPRILAIIRPFIRFSVYLISLCFVMGTDTPFTTVCSGSMDPALSTGDFLLLRRTDYQAGDICLYYTFMSVRPVIHRIIVKEGTHYVTKGDNNSQDDIELGLYLPDKPYVLFEEIAGTPCARAPYCAYPIKWFWEFFFHLGLKTICVILAAIITAYTVYHKQLSSVTSP